ncbi:MAG TPA: DHA2 family efflux MFS transporter permease subunit [Planctomycetota bacterium]|nr:DHA2 family efflux MFS transporter permease subunit [Planctomycetota bacterium]
MTSEDRTPGALLPWLVAIALFMENLDSTIVNTAVPTMAASLGVAPLSLKSVLTSYTLSLAVFIPVSGWMADRFGTRRVFSVAIVLFMAGSLSCGLASSVPLLVVSRILQGVGGAMMVPVGRLALVRAFPRSEFLRVLNFVVMPALIGPLLGPFLGGVIVHWLHWRVIFLMNLPFGILGLLLAWTRMPDFRDPAAPALDVGGFFLFGSGVALLSYVLEVFGEHSLSTPTMVAMLAVSAVLLAAYGWHARREAHPLLGLHLFKVRTFRSSVVGGFVTRLGIGGMPFLLPLLYQLGLGYAPWQAGLLTMPQAAAAILMRAFNRPILRRFGHRWTLLANSLLLGGTLMGFAAVGRETSPALFIALGFAQGFFSSLQFTSLNSLVYADVDDREASRASSISSTAQQMSLSFGVATASLVVAWFLGAVDQRDPSRAIPALHHAFLALGGLTLVSSLIFLTLHRTDGGTVSRFGGGVTAD